jgi:hypothetical protein
MFTGKWMSCYDTRRTYGAKALVSPVEHSCMPCIRLLYVHNALSPTVFRLRCFGSPTLANGKNKASFVDAFTLDIVRMQVSSLLLIRNFV